MDLRKLLFAETIVPLLPTIAHKKKEAGRARMNDST
jgi:hypothetical protein